MHRDLRTSASAAKARILFVDDERRVLNSMRGMFRRDFDLFLTTEGATAVKIAAENPIDVIVADQRMPGMSGIEVLGKVRELSPSTIRILLTGYADPTAVQGSINVGEVFRFLGKPCPPKLLRETLDQAISANRKAADATQTVAAAPRTDTRPASTPAVPVLQTPETVQRRTDSGRSRTTSSTPSSSDQLLTRLRAIGDVSYSLEHYRRRRKTETESHAPVAPPQKEASVILYTVDAQFAETALRTLSGGYDVTLATSLIKVMQAIETNDCDILVTDISAECARLQKIIAALKQVRPELVTVVVSDTRDTTDMVRLINYGQVYRFVQKPIAPSLLLEAVQAAARKGDQLRWEPGAVLRHSVALPGAMDPMDRVIQRNAQH
ncbi:MAG: response regulator [Pseudomonadota bacterium]